MPNGEFHSPEEVLDYLHNILVDKSGVLGLGYVGYGDEKLIPRYPAVIVSAGDMQRNMEQTHKFRLTINADLWVLHAKLDDSHKVRTRDDMKLATAIKTVLDLDPTLGSNIIFGYIDSETPGVMARDKGGAVVSTRLTWTGTSRQSFV